MSTSAIITAKGRRRSKHYRFLGIIPLPSYFHPHFRPYLPPYLCLCLCLILQLGGIGANISYAAQSNSESTTVSFYTWRRQDIELWEQISQQNMIPGVKIRVVTSFRHYYPDYVILELQNNNADIFLWPPGASSLKPLIEHQLIAPYEGDLSQMNASALVGGKGSDGKYYGVPSAIQLQSVMVNRKLLDKLGIRNKPSSLSELSAMFDTLKSAGVTPLHLAGGTNWYLSQVVSEVLMAGLVDSDFTQGLISGQRCFYEDEYQLIFTTLLKWQKAGYLNQDIVKGDYTVMSKAVALGNSAMSIDGGWMASPTSDFYNVDPGYKFDFWAIPGASGKVYTHGDGTFQVGTTSNKLAAAKQVLEFTKTKKFAEMFVKYVNELPAYGGDIYIPPGDLNNMATLSKQQSYAASLFAAYELNRGELPYNGLVVTAIQDLLKGKASPEQATRAIQTGLNSWQYIGHANCQQ